MDATSQRLLMGASKSLPSFEYLGNFSYASASGTTRTLTGVNIGDPDQNRVVYVGVWLNNTNTGTDTLTSLVINGVTATQAVGQTNSTSSNTNRVEIWAALVPDGTVVNVDITKSASTAATPRLTIWRGVSLATTAAGSYSTTTNSSSFSLPTGVNGCAIGIKGQTGAAATSTTWTGVVQDLAYNSGLSVASLYPTTSTSLTVNGVNNGGDGATYSVVAYASFASA